MIVRELLTRLGFKVDETGAKQYERSMDRIRTHAATLQQNLGGILGAIGITLGFAFFKDVTSQFTDLESRLANNLGADGAATAMSRLHDVALLTYQPTEQLVESFISMKSALDNLGISTEDQINLQQSIADGFTATGVKGEQAQRSLMWLNRAFTKNKMGTEEFMGVLEAGGDDLLAMLARDLNTTVGGLRDMATQGKITGKTLNDFFMRKMPEFRRQSEQMPVTINDAIGRVQEAFRWWIFETDKASGASQKIVPIIMWFAEHIEVLAGVVIGLMVPALMGLAVWVATTTTAFFGLAAALLANPLTWVAIGVAALVLAIQDLYTWITGGDSLIGRWLGPWQDVLQQMSDAWTRFTEPFGYFMADLQALVRSSNLAEAWQALLDMMIDLWMILWDQTLPGMLGLSVTDLFTPLKNVWNGIMDWISSTWDEFWEGASGSVGRAVDALRRWWRPSASTDQQAPVPGLAVGGPARAGRMHLVGEEGPELFVPGQSGTVIPAGLTAAIGDLTSIPRQQINAPSFNFRTDITVQAAPGVSPEEARQQGDTIAERMAEVFRREMRNAIDAAMPSFPETT